MTLESLERAIEQARAVVAPIEFMTGISAADYELGRMDGLLYARILLRDGATHGCDIPPTDRAEDPGGAHPDDAGQGGAEEKGAAAPGHRAAQGDRDGGGAGGAAGGGEW